MHRVVIILMFILFGLNANAESIDCINKITNNFESRVASENLALDDLDLRDYGKDYLAQSIAIIRAFTRLKGCSKKDINFGKGPWGISHSRCRLIERTSPQSRVCYVETNLGYFFTSKNLEDNVHLVFNLWD